MLYEERTYREKLTCNRSTDNDLAEFSVLVKETDLLIKADKDLKQQAFDSLIKHRHTIEKYIDDNPEFAKQLTPWKTTETVPRIIFNMICAGTAADVGPMASVAGAIAEGVGINLLKMSKEIIIENGGDVFLKVDKTMTVGLYAGQSPLSMKIGVQLPPKKSPMGICTSSGKVGHSLSFGKADAVTVLSESCPLADAAATAVGNLIQSENDMKKAILFAKEIKGVQGIIIIVGEQIACWGDIELVQI